MLLAEELAILLTRPATDRRAGGGWLPTGQDVGDVLAGGLLAELVVEGFLGRQVDHNDIWSRQRVRSDAAEPPPDPVLAQALAAIRDDRSAAAVQRRLARQSRDLVLPRMVEREILSATPRPIIGPRYALIDEAVREQLRAPLVQLALGQTGTQNHERDEVDPRHRTQLWLLQGAYCARQALGLAMGDTLALGRGIRALGKPGWPDKWAIDAMMGRRGAAVG